MMNSYNIRFLCIGDFFSFLYKIKAKKMFFEKTRRYAAGVAEIAKFVIPKNNRNERAAEDSAAA